MCKTRASIDANAVREHAQGALGRDTVVAGRRQRAMGGEHNAPFASPCRRFGAPVSDGA